jgi:hypothetical protein
MEEGFKEQVLK